MPAYVVCLREGPVRDPAEMAEYQTKTRQLQGDFKLKPLVIYGKTEALEGQAPDGIILLEFPTVEDAKAWYNSPGYQDALPHRQNAADYRFMIVEGLDR